jgi:hypothetical protein
MSAELPQYYTDTQLIGSTRTAIYRRLILDQIHYGASWLREQISRFQRNAPLMHLLAAFHTDYELSLIVNQVMTNFPVAATRLEIENYLLRIKGEINRIEQTNQIQFSSQLNRNRRDFLHRLRKHARHGQGIE